MKKIFTYFVLCFSLLWFVSSGCAQQQASNSQEAVTKAETMETVEAKVDYLLAQAQAFYNSAQFQEAVDTARYILSNLDKDSAQAQQLLEKAMAKLKEAAQKGIDDAAKKLGDLGGSLGGN